MARKIKQLQGTYSKGTDVLNGQYNVIWLGIQAKPGDSFTLNKQEDNKFFIGKTGIYEISLENSMYITNLIFQNESVNAVIDILYEAEEGV